MPTNCVNPEELMEVVYFHDMAGDSDLSAAAKRLSIPLWGRLLIWALAGMVAAATSAFVAGFIKLGKIESAVLALASKADQNVHDLVKDLLAEATKYNKSGDYARAEKALSIIPVVVAMATKNGIPAQPAYFKSSIDDLNGLQTQTANADLVRDIRRSRTVFAEYRSSLRSPITPDPKATYVALSWPLPPPGSFSFDARDGVVIDLRNVPKGVSALNPGAPPLFAGIKTDDPKHPVFLVNGTQKLDNLDWINVVFSHMVIRYDGGYVYLKNVQFVGCTFELIGNSQSDQLADYVALELPEITIKS